MKFPKLSAIDIDGTLVDPYKTISVNNAEGINEYVGAGGIVILASGRMHSAILRYANDLNLPEENIVLSYNGAMAKTIGGKLLFERPVPAVFAQQIVEYCRDNNLHLNFYHNDTLYVRELNHFSQLYLDRVGSVSVAVGDLLSLGPLAPTKLLIIDQKEKLDSLLPIFQARYGSDLFITKTDDEYLEFMAGGVDKGSGLRWVSDSLSIAQPDTAAFGDSFNDIQMLDWAGIGVAMSNGRDVAKKAADIVADNSSWSAVGDTLKSFVSQRSVTEG